MPDQQTRGVVEAGMGEVELVPYPYRTCIRTISAHDRIAVDIIRGLSGEHARPGVRVNASDVAETSRKNRRRVIMRGFESKPSWMSSEPYVMYGTCLKI